jgi:hypothetical protein
MEAHLIRFKWHLCTAQLIPWIILTAMLLAKVENIHIIFASKLNQNKMKGEKRKRKEGISFCNLITGFTFA